MGIKIDSSWSGMGGIGRFYSEVSKRLIGLTSSFSFKQPTKFYSALLNSIPCLIKSEKDICFFPGYIPPLFSRSKYIFTIHDLNHLDRGENSTLMKRIFYRLVIIRGCKKADKIITVSDFSRKRIIEWAGIEPTKVVNVGNGVGTVFSIDVRPAIFEYKYLLCVSNRKLHKNENRIIESVAKANIDTGIKLHLTGYPTEDLIGVINRFNLMDRVVFMGEVDDEQLASLYRGALGLVFPSLYEGFGLPVIEAMACGTPVLTSNTTSLPEVAGDAAILVDPESVEKIKSGIEQLVNDLNLRNKLIEKGLIRAKKFSWAAVSEQVQSVLDQVINSNE